MMLFYFALDRLPDSLPDGCGLVNPVQHTLLILLEQARTLLMHCNSSSRNKKLLLLTDHHRRAGLKRTGGENVSLPV